MKKLLRVTFTGNHNTVAWIANEFSKRGLKDRKVYDRKQGHASDIVYSRQSDIISLYNILYKDVNMFLNRKKKTFDSVINA